MPIYFSHPSIKYFIIVAENVLCLCNLNYNGGRRVLESQSPRV